MANLPVLADCKIYSNGDVQETNSPKPLYSGDAPAANTPSNTPLQCQGSTANTATQAANDSRAHACDTMLYVDRAVAYAQFYGGQIVRAIREAIKKIKEALGLNAGTSGIANLLRKIKGWADDITEFFSEINTFLNKFLAAVAKIKELINYILSLPEALINFFRNCINEAYQELSKSYTGVVSDATDSSTSQAATDAFNSVRTMVATISQTASKTVGLASAATLLNPNASLSSQTTAANGLFGSYNKQKTYSMA